ncbi:MAG: WXG100 family type VII secretion target [Pirellulales bacterium]|nr:WXG100 family type VII secretion target [Pirellulales bacterium]
MSQAIVDPGDVRRFAGQLRHFNTELLTQLSGLNKQFQALGTTWRDQEQQKFAAEFTQLMQTFNRFAQHSELYVPFLMRKAERIEEYLNQR